MSMYLLDTNTFVTAKNSYYAFDLCPGFWRAIIDQHTAGNIISIDKVKTEITDGNDILRRWVERRVPATMFPTSGTSDVGLKVGEIMDWVRRQSFKAPGVRLFGAKADPWLIAYASLNNLPLVTHEVFQADAQRRVPIPNVCKKFGVRNHSIFDVLRNLNIRFSLKRSK